ncbi:hypothetical protein GCM10022221_28460 [Actinocorallia aurea]
MSVRAVTKSASLGGDVIGAGGEKQSSRIDEAPSHVVRKGFPREGWSKMRAGVTWIRQTARLVSAVAGVARVNAGARR